LMACPKPPSVVAMEILIKQHQVLVFGTLVKPTLIAMQFPVVHFIQFEQGDNTPDNLLRYIRHGVHLGFDVTELFVSSTRHRLDEEPACGQNLTFRGKGHRETDGRGHLLALEPIKSKVFREVTRE